MVFPSFVLAAALGVVSVRAARADHVDDVITAEMRTRHIPGVALAVIQAGKIVREQGYGFRDEARRKPVPAVTLFQAASVSKPIAALGALRLVEEGKVTLDESVNARLRGWHLPGKPFHQGPSRHAAPALKPPRGLNHPQLSGLPGRGATPLPRADPRRTRPGEHATGACGPSARQPMAPLGRGLLGRAANDRRRDRAAVRRLPGGGRSESTFTQPLPGSWEGQAATGHTGRAPHAIRGGGVIHPELAAAGLWTTAGDLARFYIGVQRSLTGTSNPIISRTLTRQMLTKQGDSDSGLGFFLGGRPPRFGHNGENVGFSAVTVGFETGEGAVILMNASTDLETLENVLVEAIGEQYRWPGYPPLSHPGP